MLFISLGFFWVVCPGVFGEFSVLLLLLIFFFSGFLIVCFVGGFGLLVCFFLGTQSLSCFRVGLSYIKINANTSRFLFLSQKPPGA